MKNQSRKSKKFQPARRKSGLGPCVIGALLLALGAQARAGDALTPSQIYEGGTNTYNNWIELGGGALLTQGYAAGAERREQLNSGAFGGIEDLHYQADVAKQTTFTLDGHSIFDGHDYSLGLGLNRDDLGFVRFNIENFRTWSSGAGGYLPLDGAAYSLPGDALSLDRGQISFEAGERPIYMTGTSTYSGYLVVGFENGKVGKINFSSYETETKRKKLNSAYNNESKLIFIEHIIDDIDLVALSSINKVVLFNTSQINPVGSRTTKGFHVVKAKEGSTVLKVKKLDEVKLSDPEYYRKGLNTVGYYLKPGDEFAV